ncbi:MAG TPA: M56 family metallopeptidase, partial [Planctomycetaceae bacterium]
WRTICRLRFKGQAVTASGWLERFEDLRHRLGIKCSVRLLQSAATSVPFVVGSLRPVVVVPAAMLTGLTPAEVEAIFAHELAHVRRHDFLVNLFQNVVETLLFYHPAVWWISTQIRREREHCCDDIAVALSGGALDYARALVALVEMRPAPELVVAASGTSLLRRVRRLAGMKSGNEMAAWPVAASVLLVLATLAMLAARRSTHGGQQSAVSVPTGFTGAEIIAWVGPDVILAADVLGEANERLEKQLAQGEQPAAEEIVRRQRQEMATPLAKLIDVKLLVVDGRRKLSPENWKMIEASFSEQFTKDLLPTLLTREACKSPVELDLKLRKRGGSLEGKRREAFETSFAEYWLEAKGGNHRQEYLSGLKKRIPVWNMFVGEAMTKTDKSDPAEGADDEARALPAANGDTAVTVVSAETGLPIQNFRVLAGTRSMAGSDPQFEADHPGVTVAVWQPHTIRGGENGQLDWKAIRYDEMVLRVEADGYRPAQSDWFVGTKGPPALRFELVADAGFRGRVLQPNGQPAVGAKLAVA